MIEYLGFSAYNLGLLWKNKFDVAMNTSINAIREVLENAYSADGWTDGEYIEFLEYTQKFIA